MEPWKKYQNVDTPEDGPWNKYKAQPEIKQAPELSFLQKAAGAVGDVLPVAGATVGGLLGIPAAVATGPAAPLTEAAAIGAGYLTGKMAERRLRQLAGLPRKEGAQSGPQGIKTEAIEVAKDLPEAAVVGVSGPLGGKLASSVTNRLSTYGMGQIKMTPEMKGRLVLAQESEVPLTIADISQKKVPSMIESQLRRQPGSLDITQEADQAKRAALQRYATKVQSETFGGPEDALIAGQKAQQMASARYKGFQAKASSMYEKVPVDPATPIETSRLKEIAGQELDALGKVNHSTVKRILNAVQEADQQIPSVILDASGKPITTKVQPAYKWDELLSDQSTLRKLARTTPDYNLKRIYRDMVHAINDDIALYAQRANDPAIQQRLESAVKYYRDGDAKLPGVKVWRDNQIMQMMKTNSPEDIVKKFMRASPNTSDIARLKRVAGDKGFQAIKQAWLDDLMTLGEGNSFSPARFATWYDKYRAGGNLNIILSRQEKIGLDKLYEVSRIINTSEKLMGNPSGTGQININDLYRWVRHPIMSTINAVGTKQFSKAYFTDPNFRSRVLTTLNQSPAQSLGMSKPLAIAGAESAMDVLEPSQKQGVLIP